MEDIVEVKIKKKEINFIVWALPVISLLIGGWLLYKYYSSLGPLIEIYFKNSGGLEPKKSYVRFRDVKVGVVEDVELLKKGVLVKVRMHKDAEPFLNETTKFWIVKPTVEVGKIKGLEALITGPYIQMYAKEGKFTKKKFIGLEEPPLDSDILKGKIIKLIAENSYGLKEKMPVYFKEIKVGSIRKVELNSSKVNIYISIKKNYAKYINDTTKFWNIRGIDVNFDKDNLKMEIPGISQLLIGGVEFDTLEVNSAFTKKFFILYPSRSDAFENKLGGNKKYVDIVMYVKNDKNGLLRVGNPLIYKDFKVGHINYLNSKLDLENLDILTECISKLDVSAFGGEDGLKKALKKGLKAKIVKNNPVFENIKIELVFTGKGNVNIINGRFVIPVIKVKEESIVEKINKILDKLSKIDYEKNINSIGRFFNDTNTRLNILLNTATKTLKSIDETIKNEEFKNIPKNINETLKNINELIRGYSKDSIFYIKLNELLNETHKSIKLLQKIEKKIDNKPNALIFGE